MARITQLLIQAEHKPGTLANICSELAKKAVNITAIMAAYDQPGGRIRLVAAAKCQMLFFEDKAERATRLSPV